ncbi:MAG: UPF0175 family protein [Armatimonadetes bacterium]|nr:UPF0175 family protein [Armatimonadota bacterium]
MENQKDLLLHIPDDIAQAIRLPESRIESELKIELGLALYAQGLLSFGKARELSGLTRYEFSRLLGNRAIPRHYESDDLEDDLAYARG